MEEEQQEDKNQRIKPWERAHVQKRLEHIMIQNMNILFFWLMICTTKVGTTSKGHPFLFLLTSFFVSTHRTHRSCQCCKLLNKWKDVKGKIGKDQKDINWLIVLILNTFLGTHNNSKCKKNLNSRVRWLLIASYTGS